MKIEEVKFSTFAEAEAVVNCMQKIINGDIYWEHNGDVFVDYIPRGFRLNPVNGEYHSKLSEYSYDDFTKYYYVDGAVMANEFYELCNLYNMINQELEHYGWTDLSSVNITFNKGYIINLPELEEL